MFGCTRRAYGGGGALRVPVLGVTKGAPKKKKKAGERGEEKKGGNGGRQKREIKR